MLKHQQNHAYKYFAEELLILDESLKDFDDSIYIKLLNKDVLKEGKSLDKNLAFFFRLVFLLFKGFEFLFEN